MKRCQVCRSNYPFSHTVCPFDGTRLEEVQTSTAVAPIIEIQRSAFSVEEEEQRDKRTLHDDLREFLEDHRLHKLYFTFGVHGVELQLTRAAVSLGLFSFGTAAVGLGLLTLWGDVVSGSLFLWLPDMLFAIGMAGMVASRNGFRRAGAITLAGVVFLAYTLHFVDLSLWPLLTAAGGGFSLLYRRRMRISGISLKLVS
jgi:hypothetical protein